MNKTIVALAAWLATAPLHAQQAAPGADAATSAAGPSASAPIAASPISWNAALVSDYRYRGISQTRLRPALQGGADVADAASGLYAGTWLSTIRWSRDAGVTVSLAVVGTNADRAAYASPANGKFTGRTALVGGVARVF